MKWTKNWLSVFACLLTLAPITAQNSDLPITLESPQQTMLIHLNYLQAESYDPAKAARALAGAADSAQAARRAVLLKQVLDATVFVRIGTIPNNPDYVDSTTNEAIYVPFPIELPGIYLEKIDDRWYYSRETVNRVPEIHRRLFPFGSDFLMQLFPKFGQKQFLGLAIWQYAGLLLLLAAGVIVHIVLSFLLRLIFKRLSGFRLHPHLIPIQQINRLARYASIWLVLWVIKLGLPSLLLPPRTADFANKTIWVISTFMVLLILLKVVDIAVLYIRMATHKTENRLDDQLVPIFKNLVQILIIGAVIIQVFRIFQIDITAIIAGLSIGGLALALAAKDTAQNLFGSVTLFLDRPFQVGDWISFEDVDGTVEEIGIRATRIRTFANSLVYVPNGKLANLNLNNYGLRHYRRFSTKISVTYDTPPELIEEFVKGLRQIVKEHPNTRKDYFEVHLNDFAPSSLDILFYIFFEVPSWSEELKSKHEVMLSVVRLAKEMGVKFAFPSSSIYIEQMPAENGAG